MYKKLIKILILFYFISNIFILGSNLASASFIGGDTQGELWEQMDKTGTQAYGAKPSGARDLPKLVATIISAFLGLLGVIFVVLIIYAGYSWMTASGDEEKVKKAKDTLTQAVIGLIIITAAYAITYFVFSNLPGGTGGSPLITSPTP